MFSIEDRNRVRDRALELASSDERLVSGAVVGSLALDEGDRWSDLDLTFAVADGLPVLDVLDDWTRSLVAEFGALDGFRDALVRSLDREELRRALREAIAGLLREADEVRPLAERVQAQLRSLAGAQA